MRVLDMCTGSGIVAVSAGQSGAACVVAVDISRRAVLTTRLNAVVNGVHVDARCGDLFTPVAGERFDLIVSNPPYLPGEETETSVRGLARAWEGGRNGRALLDRLIAAAPAYLRPGGALLVIHSSVCGFELTEKCMHAAGLQPEMIMCHRGPLGPLLTARAFALETRGLLPLGTREEDIAIFKGQKL
jgi:release factor glutamine methyltransferase